MPARVFCKGKEIKDFKAYAFECKEDLNREYIIILNGYSTNSQIFLDYFHKQTLVDIEVTHESLPNMNQLSTCLIKGLEYIIGSESEITKMRITLVRKFLKQKQPFIFR